MSPESKIKIGEQYSKFNLFVIHGKSSISRTVTRDPILTDFGKGKVPFKNCLINDWGDIVLP